MSTIKIELHARAGCWYYAIHLDGETISRNGNCFTDPHKGLKAALGDIARSRKTINLEISAPKPAWWVESRAGDEADSIAEAIEKARCP